MNALLSIGRKALDAFRPRTRAADGGAAGFCHVLPRPAASAFSAGYEPVTARHAEMRRAAVVETRGEDWQLPASKRLRLTNLLRDMLRNSPAFVMQNRQMLVNVVGSEGGKLHASFPPAFRAAADEVMDWFNGEWAPRAEFTFGRSFNWTLKAALTARDCGGNVALVFDDGILTGGDGTGRLRAFEGDEIADVPRLADYFPEGFTQSQGFVYDAAGAFCGAFVSTSQRGRTAFDPAAGVLVLRRDPFSSAAANWTMLGDMARFNQGRAVSALASSLISLIDLHETVSSEALAAKLTSQLVAQIVHTEDEPRLERGGFDGGGGGAETVRVEKSQALRNIGLQTQDMPKGTRLEMLDTKRPNAALEAYVDFVLGLAGGARGFARVYSTLRAQTSYTAFRGEQIMTWKVFRDMQKELEREVCDWAARCAISRAARLGLIRSALPRGWERMLAWSWPRMAEVSEKDAEAARLARLQNGVTSLRREMGPGEFERVMAERAAEKRLFDEAGLVYPGETSVSGAVKETPAPQDGAEAGETGSEEPGADAPAEKEN